LNSNRQPKRLQASGNFVNCSCMWFCCCHSRAVLLNTSWRLLKHSTTLLLQTPGVLQQLCVLSQQLLLDGACRFSCCW
jgi:hypothetical protein